MRVGFNIFDPFSGIEMLGRLGFVYKTKEHSPNVKKSGGGNGVPTTKQKEFVRKKIEENRSPIKVRSGLRKGGRTSFGRITSSSEKAKRIIEKQIPSLEGKIKVRETLCDGEPALLIQGITQKQLDGIINKVKSATSLKGASGIEIIEIHEPKKSFQS